MIIHICVGTRDLEKAGTYYDAITAEMGLGRTNQTDTAIYYGGGAGIGFAVTLPYNGEPATFGNGTMATMNAADEDQVRRVHAAALANGGSCEGPPGTRANGFYAAYFRDPDGNKMNIICAPAG